MSDDGDDHTSNTMDAILNAALDELDDSEEDDEDEDCNDLKVLSSPTDKEEKDLVKLSDKTALPRPTINDREHDLLESEMMQLNVMVQEILFQATSAANNNNDNNNNNTSLEATTDAFVNVMSQVQKQMKKEMENILRPEQGLSSSDPTEQQRGISNVTRNSNEDVDTDDAKEKSSSSSTTQENKEAPKAVTSTSTQSITSSSSLSSTNSKTTNSIKKTKSDTTTTTRPPAKTKTTPKRPVFGPEPPPKDDTDDLDRTISKLLNDMATSATTTGNDNEDNGDVPDNWNDLEFQNMWKELQNALGNNSTSNNNDNNHHDNAFDASTTTNHDLILDGMMQQLMTKDLMYEPIQDVCQKFPQWLQDHETILPVSEYKSRCEQYQGLQSLLHVYDTEPTNTTKLMSVMKQVQEYGLPPLDIVSDVCPELELDADGIPKLPSNTFGTSRNGSGANDTPNCPMM